MIRSSMIFCIFPSVTMACGIDDGDVHLMGALLGGGAVAGLILAGVVALCWTLWKGRKA
jgi:hypothetical protein